MIPSLPVVSRHQMFAIPDNGYRGCLQVMTKFPGHVILLVKHSRNDFFMFIT